MLLNADAKQLEWVGATYLSQDSTAIKEEIRVFKLDMDSQLAAETDEEAAELLAVDLQEQLKALENQIVNWPTIPPKGEGDKALDLWGILECDYAFA